MFMVDGSDNLRYTTRSFLDYDTDTEVMMGFITQANDGQFLMVSNRVQFLIPPDWLRMAPMQYLAATTQVDATINGDGPFPFDLTYGYAGYEGSNDCSASHWSSAVAPYRGQLMIEFFHVKCIFKLLSFTLEMLGYRAKRRSEPG